MVCKWEGDFFISRDPEGNILPGLADLGLFLLMDAYFRLASNQVMFHLIFYSDEDSKESNNNGVVLEHFIDLLISNDLTILQIIHLKPSFLCQQQHKGPRISFEMKNGQNT